MALLDSFTFTSCKFLGTGLFAALVITPAQAQLVSFANTGAGGNVRYQNRADAGANAPLGSLFTVASPGATTPGAVSTTLSFTNLGITGLSNLPVTFRLNASSNDRELGGLQSGFSGSFSFTNSQRLRIAGISYAPGSNLLSGTFSNYSFNNFSGPTIGQLAATRGVVAFTSDFLDFTGVTGGRLQVIVENASPAIQGSTTNDGFDSFDSTIRSTVFLASTVPMVVNAVPEPATWAMLIAGFGMAGLALRREQRRAAAAT
jgi:hypothetical protein